MYIFAVAMSLATATQVSDCIQIARPEVSETTADRYGAIIAEVSYRYDLDPKLLVAIIAQETGFRRWPRRANSNGTQDHGLAQINTLWIKHWDLDPKLLEDDRYNLMVAGRILAHYRDRYGHESRWWSRYHSGTPHVRQRYEKLILKYLELLEGYDIPSRPV